MLTRLTTSMILGGGVGAAKFEIMFVFEILIPHLIPCCVHFMQTVIVCMGPYNQV